jgi:hypothetical protein
MKLPLVWKHYPLKLLIIITIVSLLLGCRKRDIFRPQPEENADVVYAWYKFIARVQLKASPQPVVLVNVRNFGYIGVGLYESVRNGIKGAVSLSTRLYQMPAMPQPEANQEYLWSASANAALASMFKQFLAGLTDADKKSIDSMETANNNRFLQTISQEVLTRSETFGRAIANAIYNWSTTDNFNLSSTGYILPVFPGSWVPTPPTFTIVGPFLQHSRPFLEFSLTATAPPLPFPYSEDTASKFYKAAKQVYDIGKSLTAEQKAIANWWADVGGSGVGVPAPYHLTSIITEVLESRKAKLGRAAELYAKTGIAFRDGNIITFRAKYQYNLLRPVTYIQKLIDNTWQSYLPNPAYPEYISGLVGLYGPLIQVLIRAYGDIPVTDHTYDWRGDSPRAYGSLSELLNEAAVSRVYAGIHYQFTQEITIDISKDLGNKVYNISLIPVSKYW